MQLPFIQLIFTTPVTVFSFIHKSGYRFTQQYKVPTKSSVSQIYGSLLLKGKVSRSRHKSSAHGAILVQGWCRLVSYRYRGISYQPHGFRYGRIDADGVTPADQWWFQEFCAGS